MAKDLITVRNTLNGQLAQVQPAILRNPHLAKHYVVVPDDAKPQVLIRPSTAEEYTSRRQVLSSNILESEDDEVTTEEG